MDPQEISNPTNEPSMTEMMRELMRRMERIEHRLPRSPPSRHDSEQDQEDPPSSDEERPLQPPQRFGMGYDRRPPPPATTYPNYGIKVDLPQFEGNLDPDEFLEWLQTMERIFEYQDIPDNRKVKLAAIKLTKTASLWWENLKRARHHEGKQKITTWEKMRRELMKKFLPPHYRQDMFLRLHKLQQKDLSVEAYMKEFEHLTLKCDLKEPEEHTIARFLGGLKIAIGNVVQLQQFQTLRDVQSLALKVEKQQAYRSVAPSKPSSTSGPPVGTTSTPASTAPTARSDHKRPEMPDRRQCFKCQGFGHIASACPTRALMSATDQAVLVDIEEEQITADEPLEEVRLEADDGDLLMVQRVLQLEPTPEQPQQRNCIFRTRCTVGSKVCTLIIDGGSCENVVASQMVRKLNLKTEKHSTPYSLAWLNTGNEIRVTKRCLVQFSIGDCLQEEVWCDVVPMDAGHILLGRPWQYDRKITHDGFNNTYSLVKDGRRITLLPGCDKSSEKTLKQKSGMMRLLLFDTGQTVMPKPLPPRENDRDGLVTVAVCYSNTGYCSGRYSNPGPSLFPPNF